MSFFYDNRKENIYLTLLVAGLKMYDTLIDGNEGVLNTPAQPQTGLRKI